MKTRRDVTVSSGNVFRDLGLPLPEEALAKAELTSKIAAIIASKALTQAAAAKILGVDQPKISALLRGRLTSFSTERLMKFLRALGSNVQIVVEDRPKAKGPGHLRVVLSGGLRLHG